MLLEQENFIFTAINGLDNDDVRLSKRKGFKHKKIKRF